MDLEIVSYQDVIDGYAPYGDDKGIAAYAIAEPRKSAFLNNPNLIDTSKKMFSLVRHEGKIIGRSMSFPTKLKVGDSIIDIVAGSALQVVEKYRSGDAGMLLVSEGLTHKENNAQLSSGFSKIGAQCQKALGSYMLHFPQMIQIRNYTKLLPGVGVPRLLSGLLGCLANIVCLPIRYVVDYKGNRLKEIFDVEKVDIVPEWVDDIVLNDGHKYMEVHNHKWLQWNLDNMFHAHKKNSTSFYTVSQNGNHLGFFMIKERHQSMKSKGIDSAVFGSIVEWGTKDTSILSEYKLQIMALSSFSKNVDMVYLATTDNDVVKKMRRLFVFQKGEAVIALKDLRKQWKEAKDKTLWRLRLGYSDSILN
jgi:hypothetical protein